MSEIRSFQIRQLITDVEATQITGINDPESKRAHIGILVSQITIKQGTQIFIYYAELCLWATVEPANEKSMRNPFTICRVDNLLEAKLKLVRDLNPPKRIPTIKHCSPRSKNIFSIQPQKKLTMANKCPYIIRMLDDALTYVDYGGPGIPFNYFEQLMHLRQQYEPKI